MKISVIGPVKNEVQFIGYSIMAVLPYIHEIIYACADSDDGTDILLGYIKDKYAKDKLTILRKPEYDFNVRDMASYNQAFNDCIERSTGQAVWFLHPDMICANPERIPSISPQEGMAWWTNLTSYAKDYETVITKGRATKWKNIQSKKMGLHYYGGYGSQNEDFYFRDITGSSYKHFGEEFKAYPYRVTDSKLNVNHYCELKDYKRRYEKMKACLHTLYPGFNDFSIDEMAQNHPRVSLEEGFKHMGDFEFRKQEVEIPKVFNEYKEEFESVLKEKSWHFQT